RSNMYTIGIDSGSVATKGILFDGKIVKKIITPTGWNPKETSINVLKELTIDIKKNDIKSIIGTGYGRLTMDFIDDQVTEITCHAKGGYFLNDEIDTILDIGGQDSKVIGLNKNGNIKKFVMNDKCAAGTGKFLEETMNKIGITLDEIDEFDKPSNPINISSMCAVFASSEVVSLLAKGTSKNQIIYGISNSIANKTINLVSKVNTSGNVLFTGGLSQSEIIKDSLKEKLNRNIITNENSQYAGAIGAALIGFKK
ncbi:MAG: acyl-CoA dehydratase activase, partial [Bacillota bacterium]